MQDLATCEQSGRDLAIQVKRRLKQKEKVSTSSMAAAVASGSQLAMGRVIGSLSVVTARDEEAVSAMLASWMTQVGASNVSEPTDQASADDLLQSTERTSCKMICSRILLLSTATLVPKLALLSNTVCG